MWHLHRSLTWASAMPHRHAMHRDYRFCDGGWQRRESVRGNHVLKSLCGADTQPIKGVLVITGEARKWPIQIGACISNAVITLTVIHLNAFPMEICF